MNFNISPIAFYPSRAAQPWRAWFYQCKVAVSTGENLLPFMINDTPLTAPNTVEIYNAYDDTLAATINDVRDILAHTSTVDGHSVNSWIYQGTSSGIFGYTQAGYYYLKIGNYYSDVIKFGEIALDYVKLNWQFYDDIITADGTLISKYVEYCQIFETELWHPAYNVTEEGKENNGIFYATQQTTKKNCGFTALVNEAQVDCLNLTRMADTVQIEARVNGVVKTFKTNTFEIKSDWQSDDVASIECQFDLFNIIRKYQISNEKPEPLPIPTPPTPPSLKSISGTLSESVPSITILYNGNYVTIPCANKEFEWGFDDEPVGELAFGTNKDKIKTLDLSNAGTLNSVTRMKFDNMPALTSVDFSGVEYKGLTTTNGMFLRSNITNVSLPDATFESVTDADGMFFDANCTQISMPSATFDSVTVTDYMFALSNHETTINLPVATFALATTASEMFVGCNVTKITMPSATFANVTDFGGCFSGAHGNMDFGALFPSCTAQPTDLEAMFSNYDGNVDITDLDCTNVTNADSMFTNCTATGASGIQLPSSLGNITTAVSMFRKCQAAAAFGALADLGALSSLTDASYMFSEVTGNANQSVSVQDATFANVTNVQYMFQSVGIGSISLPSATFASVENANHMVYNCANLHTFNIPSATFASLTNAQDNAIFEYCNNLANITLASGDNIGLDSGGGFFRLVVLLPSVSSTSLISILDCGKTVISGTATNQLRILNTRWNSYTSQEQNDIIAAKKNGWTIVGVN